MNEIETKGAEMLSEALTNNTSLTSLDISCKKKHLLPEWLTNNPNNNTI